MKKLALAVVAAASLLAVAPASAQMDRGIRGEGMSSHAEMHRGMMMRKRMHMRRHMMMRHDRMHHRRMMMR